MGLVFNRYLDLPAFLLANVVVDLEPLAVMTFRWDYPMHGYFHTFLVGGLVGAIWGMGVFGLRGVFQLVMEWLRLAYQPGVVKAVVSGVLGVWLHVLLDGMIYQDISPFFPWERNPLLGLVNAGKLYSICGCSILAAVVIYIVMAWRGRMARRKNF